MNSCLKYYILEKWPKSSLCVTRRTRNFWGLTSDIMTFYQNKSKSTEIYEDLKNARVLWRKFVFLLRNLLKIGKILAKNRNLKGSKDRTVFCLVNTVRTDPCWHFGAKNRSGTPSLLFNRRIMLLAVTVHEGLWAFVIQEGIEPSRRLVPPPNGKL